MHNGGQTMIYVIIGISLIFGSLTFNLTKVNAQHYLAGNNTMPKEQREQIDIEAYLRMFKKAYFILNLSTYFFLRTLDEKPHI